MIKLFRNIRQSLIMENQIDKSTLPVGKYLKYAIGEIVLVVIGIVIALQINNWNEFQKLKQSEAAILLDLKEELKSNIEIANESVKTNLTNTGACISIDSIIKTNKLTSNLNKLDSLFIKLGNISSFKPERSTTDQMINSGKLEIISNTNLKSLITNWITELEKSENDIKYAIDNYTMNLMPYLMKHFPLSNGDTIKKNFPSFIPMYGSKSNHKIDYSKLNLLEFENNIWNHKHNIDYLIRRDMKLSLLVKPILKEINTSLKTLNAND